MQKCFFGYGNDAAATIANLNRVAAYEPVATIDVDALDRFRPEIGWHAFSAITDFDPARDAIFIWKRRQ